MKNVHGEVNGPSWERAVPSSPRSRPFAAGGGPKREATSDEIVQFSNLVRS